jgi:hypothetical protein
LDRAERIGGPPSQLSDAGADPIRRLLLALVLIGAAGLAAELLLLEHTESATQWLPLLVIAAIFITSLALLARPSRRLLRLFQGVMALAVLIGGLGVYLHFDGNTEFELEMDPAVRGLALVWSALRGATPALAPGALVQLGLLGLISTYRHPLLRRPAQDRSPPAWRRAGPGQSGDPP